MPIACRNSSRNAATVAEQSADCRSSSINYYRQFYCIRVRIVCIRKDKSSDAVIASSSAKRSFSRLLSSAQRTEWRLWFKQVFFIPL